jgi:hypothetical protein
VTTRRRSEGGEERESAYYTRLQVEIEQHLDAVSGLLTDAAPNITESLTGMRARQSVLHEMLDRFDRQVERCEQLVSLLAEIAGDSGQLHVPGGLRGKAIGDAAIRALRAAGRAGEPIHYRVWFQLFEQQGYRVDGLDATAGFLTAIGRHPLIERVTSSSDRSGLYRVKEDTDA